MINIESIKTKFVNKLYNLQKKYPSLNRINIEITRQCNLKCKHCYMDATFEKDKNELTKEELFLLADTLKKGGYKNIEIVFTGGEPLIRDDFIEIAQYYKKIGFRCSLVTNGVFLNKTKLKIIQSLFYGFNISIDGLSNYHNRFRGGNVFNITIENIKHILELGNNLTIKTVITKDNIKNLEEIYTLFQQLGVKKWHIINLSYNGRGKKLDNFLDENDYLIIGSFTKNIKNIEIFWENPIKKEHKKCLCGILECSILYNGDVVGCLNADRTNTTIYGNIKNNSIIDIWDSGFSAYRNKDFYNCN